MSAVLQACGLGKSREEQKLDVRHFPGAEFLLLVKMIFEEWYRLRVRCARGRLLSGR